VEAAVAKEDITTIDTIRDLKNRAPFEPITIVLSSGDRYVIDDPDALAIGTQQVFYYPRQPGAGVHLRSSQIAAVENGSAKRPRRRKAS
jgi:hypothetical protein